jgi:hypothetical protein
MMHAMYGDGSDGVHSSPEQPPDVGLSSVHARSRLA